MIIIFSRILPGIIRMFVSKLSATFIILIVIIEVFSLFGDLYRSHIFVKAFEDLALEYDISIKDRHKYNFLMNGILLDCFIVHVKFRIPFLIITKSSYNLLKSQECREFLNWNFGDDDDNDWAAIHGNNFNCTICAIDTQIRAVYFKNNFHRAICTNQFLHKIGRIDSPLCHICQKFTESYIHMFCNCENSFPYRIIWAPLLTKNVVKF